MKEKNTNIIDNIANLQNQEPNNQRQLEILACNETLQDLEKYLLDRGFDEMINCITSNNESERQNFSYFFKYFGFEKDINSQYEAKLFILNLKQILTTLNNKNDTDKKQQLLAIIAVALQNCKLRSVCGPESRDYTKQIGKNLISLLSQAQYFLRYAKDCKVAWKERCFKSEGFIETNDREYKTTDIIDTNNFLYTKKLQLNTSNMILTKTGETANMDLLAETHFRKISTTIHEKAENLRKNNNLQIETTIPTANLWGRTQNHIIFSQYSNQWKNDDNLLLTINTSASNTLLQETQDIKQNIGQNIRIYDYKRQGLINIKNNKLEQTESNVNQYPYNTDKQRTIYVNAGDHLAFTGNEGYMFFQNQQDISNKKYNNRPAFGSLDVNMASTEFFRFFGANGQLCHGFFTFNNKKTSYENFQSLSMPNKFIFKEQLIDARQFITDMNIMLKKEDNNFNTFNEYNMSQIQQGKQNNNGYCDCLKQAFPCFNNCF